MSTATELLRRALKAWENGRMLRDMDDAMVEIRTFLAVEPEVEYDLSEVIPLTHRKSKGIIKDRGYNVTGFVLTRKDGDKCIVDMSAVRWLTGKEFFEMMHPPVVSPTAEPEAEPVFIRPDHLALARKSPFLCQVGPVQVADFIPLYTRPEPARKPMTEEEIKAEAQSEKFNRCDAIVFAVGVRFAEKHHGIGGDDVRETPGD